MSNTAFITLKTQVNMTEVQIQLGEAMRDCFPGLGNSVYPDPDESLAVFGELNNEVIIDLWQEGRRKIASGHRSPFWKEWVWAIVWNRLAYLLGGLKSDEGTNEHWDPEPWLWPTFEDFVRGGWGPEADSFLNQAEASWPEWLRPWYRRKQEG